MTDAALENAIAVRDGMAEKITRAEEQIKEWRSIRDRAERFIRDWEEFSGAKAPGSVSAEPAPVTAKSLPLKKPQNPKKEEVARVAQVILRDHGQPMSRDDLFDALRDRGIIIHGQNPNVVLQTMLWRMQEVIAHIKGFGYWPTKDECATAGYSPIPPLQDDDPVVRDIV